MTYLFRDRDFRPLLLLLAMLGVVWLRHHPRLAEGDEPGPAVSLDQARGLFPEADSLKEGAETGEYSVVDAAGERLGRLLVSGPDTKRVTGYGGPTPVAVGLDAAGKVRGVVLLDNAESEDYLQDVLDSGLLASWDGLVPDEALRKRVDAVSGATMSSDAIIETVQLTLQPLVAEPVARARSFRFRLVLAAVWLVLLADLGLFFFAKRLRPLRLWILGLNVAVIGFWAASMLSLSQLGGWVQHGIPARAWLATGIMAVLALLLPLFTGRDFYCTCVCPFGSFQDILGALRRRSSLRVPPRLASFLCSMRGLLLGLVWLGLIAGVALDLARVEPFAAFQWRIAGAGSLILAGVFLALALWLPRGWCRFFCPTGRLLRVARCSREGAGKTGGWVGFRPYCLGLLVAAAAWLAWNSVYLPVKDTPDMLEVIHSRRSVRNYTDEPVTPEQIEVLLRAGMAAPTARNMQPWAFVVVTERDRLKQLADHLPYGKMLARAGAAIVVCADMERALPGIAREMWVQDCSAAAQNILLAAEGIGLGAVWIGVHPIPDNIAAVRRLLDLPETVQPLNVVSIGHPLGIEEPKYKYDERKIHREVWRGKED